MIRLASRVHGTFQKAQAEDALLLLGPLLKNLEVLLLLAHIVQLLLFQTLLVQLDKVFDFDLLDIKLLTTKQL